jgi:hypothetical protein
MRKLAVQLVRTFIDPNFYLKLTVHLADACQPSLQAAPVCADSSWNLWNTTNVDGTVAGGDTGYLCCLPGQIGVQGNVDTVGESAICVEPGTPFVQSASGTLVSRVMHTYKDNIG